MKKTLSEAERIALRQRIEETAGGRERAHPAAVVLTEAFGPMRAARLNKAANTIMGCTMLGPLSSNGVNRKRRYSRKAMEQVVKMAEGLRAYANHTSPDLAFKPRDVRDLIGKHVNVKYDPATNRIVSDLQLLEHQAGWVFSLAERLGDQIGNSLVSKGLVKMEADGTETVDEIVQLASADLVTDPATCRGLFEARDEVLAELDAILREQTPDDVPARLREILNGPGLPDGIHQETVRLLRLPSPPSESAAPTDLHARLVKAVTSR